MTASAFARDHLKAFVERIERVHEERKALGDDIRDLYAEAKANGFDVKALKIVIGRRAKDTDALSELDAIVETYETALGTPVATRAPARAQEPDPLPARPAPIKRHPAAPPRAAAPSDDGLDIPPELDRRRRQPEQAAQ